MKPDDIAKIIRYRGPSMFHYITQCLKLAPAGLSKSKVEAFAANPEKDPVTAEHLNFLIDCVKQRFVKVEEYHPLTGDVVRSGMVRVASTKSAEPVIMAPKGATMDPKLAAFLHKSYVAGAGNVLGKTTAAKGVAADTTAAQERFEQRRIAENRQANEAAAAKKPKPAVLPLMTFGKTA